MKYSRNQIKTQRHILTCSIVAFEAFSNLLLLWTFTTLSWVQPFVSILYAEAHGHLPALPLQGDLMWSSGTSSLEQALPASGASLTGLLFFMFYSSSSFAALPPSPEEPPPCVAHHAFHMRPWAVLWCSFLLLHIPFLAALRTMIPKSQMLLFTSLLIKILLNLQDPSQTLSPWWSSDSISSGSKPRLSSPPCVIALRAGSHSFICAYPGSPAQHFCHQHLLNRLVKLNWILLLFQFY